MAGDPLKHVRPGDALKIPAAGYNAMVDAAKAEQMRRHGIDRSAKPGFAQTGIVLVKNNSGADRDRFDVLGVDAPIFTPAENLDSFKNDRAFKGITPATTSHLGKFVILFEPLKDGKIGPAIADGMCPVRVNVTDELHEYADIANGQCGYLASGYIGTARIVWKESGTGTKWALVRLADDTPVMETMWCRVMDGTWPEFGKPKMYPTYTAGGNDYGLGWYVDEVAYPVLDEFYPSRTRDAANDWIETIVYNRSYFATLGWPWEPSVEKGSGFWPAPDAQLIRAYRLKVNASWQWYAFEPPTAAYGIVTAIDAPGVVTRATWFGQDNGGPLTISVDVSTIRTLTNPPAGYVWYPYPQIGDQILLVPHDPGLFWGILAFHKMRWYDATPRIPLKAGAFPGDGVDVQVDTAAGSGRPWSLDTDT